MWIDESSFKDGSRVGLVFTLPEGELLKHAIILKFKSCNHEVEYEARLEKKMGNNVTEPTMYLLASAQWVQRKIVTKEEKKVREYQKRGYEEVLNKRHSKGANHLKHAGLQRRSIVGGPFCGEISPFSHQEQRKKIFNIKNESMGWRVSTTT